MVKILRRGGGSLILFGKITLGISNAPADKWVAYIERALYMEAMYWTPVAAVVIEIVSLLYRNVRHALSNHSHQYNRII